MHLWPLTQKLIFQSRRLLFLQFSFFRCTIFCVKESAHRHEPFKDSMAASVPSAAWTPRKERGGLLPCQLLQTWAFISCRSILEGAQAQGLGWGRWQAQGGAAYRANFKKAPGGDSPCVLSSGDTGQMPTVLRQQCPGGCSTTRLPHRSKSHSHTGLQCVGFPKAVEAHGKSIKGKGNWRETEPALPQCQKWGNANFTGLALTKTKQEVSGMGSKKFFTWVVFLWVPMPTSC